MPDLLDIQLSPHFRLREFCQSDMAEEKSIVNIPPDNCLDLVQEFCREVLEPIREKWGAVYINSGYRSPALNRLVHGVPDSQHVWNHDHCAADIALQVSLAEVYEWLRTTQIPYDQCVLEHDKETGIPRCIHISYTHTPRRMAGRGGTHNTTRYIWDDGGPSDA